MKSEKLTFAISVTLLQLFGISILVMVGVWMGHYRGGFAWDGSVKEFNYHPVCMIVSMIFLNSEGNSCSIDISSGIRGAVLPSAMIVFRVFNEGNKFKLKLLHMSIQAIAFVFGVVGLKAVFDFHNHLNMANMYSLHSWIGLGCYILFACQLVFGFLGFLYPMFPDGLRAAYLKVHVFFGVTIFMLAVATCLTGVTEKIMYSVTTDYKNLPPEAVLANVLGVALVIHAGLAYFIVTNDAFKHTATPEEQQQLLELSGEPQDKE